MLQPDPVPHLPIINVALCTYNGAKYLDRQIQSILNQTYPNIHVIALDDCSSDSTLSILKKYESESFSIFINPTNLGYNLNFEKCLNLCQHSLIAPCDQDDIWKPNKLEILHMAMDKDTLMTYADSDLIDSSGNPLNKTVSCDLKYRMQDIANPLQLIYKNCISGHSMLLKKELIELASPFEPNIFFDWWLSIVAASNGNISFVDASLVCYRKHSESVIMSGIKSKKKKEIPERELHNRFIQTLSKAKLSEGGTKEQIQELANCYAHKPNLLPFSIKRFSYLLKHRKVLFSIRNKSFTSTLNFIIKESIR